MNAVVLPREFEIPSRRTEAWKYSDLRRVLRELPAPSPALDEAVQAGGVFAGLADAELVIANGRMNWWPEDEPVAGIEFFEATEADAPSTGDDMPLAALAAASAMDAVQIVTVDGVEPRTLSLRWVSQADGTGHHARVGVVVGKGASAVLLETQEGSGTGYFANHLLEIIVEEGGRLERVSVLDEPDSAISVTSATVRLSAGAHYSHTVLAAGAKLQRHETRVTHPGHGASVRLDGLYVLAGSRHADLTTVVDHQGVGGETSQLTKGVVADSARGVFQGRIVVDRGADQTDARMGHHALILSDRAEIDAKPELEIYADDVSCAHGNTIGALDENALFYARARGVPEHEARVMLTQAFLGEVTDRITHEGAREAAQAWLAERLEALL